MSEILQIFTGNPLTTLVGRKIDAATNPLLATEDWALNMDICDTINENDDEAKNAVRAIRKRLQQIEQDRDFTAKSYTYLLTVLETCVSNCSHRFHSYVMTKDFIQDLVKFIGPKNNPPIDLQERVLRLIERWAENFKNHPELNGVVQVYNELKAKGVIFPIRDASTDVPIETPQPRNIPRPPPNTRASSMSRSQAQVSADQAPVLLEGEVYTKICSDLEVVQTSLNVFNSILDQIESTEPNKKTNEQEDWSLAGELDTTCKQMKERIIELISKVTNEDLTLELLRLNDELNSVFTRYEGLLTQKNQAGTSSSLKSHHEASSPTNIAQASGLRLLNSVSASSSTSVQPKSTPEDETSLIDFKDDEARQLQQALDEAANDKLKQQHQLNPSPNPFDTSAVADAFLRADESFGTSARNLLVDKLDKLRMTDEQKELESAARVCGDFPEAVGSTREQDFVEMENWLKSDGGIKIDQPSDEPASLKNTEFENFLAGRALASSQSSDANPNRSATTDTTSATSGKTCQADFEPAK